MKSTDNVVAVLARKPRTDAGAAKVLVNGSATGYYGPHGDEELDETALPGNDFLAELCVAWEKSAAAAQSAGIRVVMLRTGAVLDKAGGALAPLLTPFKLCMGGRFGSGRQWMPWIHHADEVGLLLLALDRPEAQGPINGTAPTPVTNKQFAKCWAERCIDRPLCRHRVSCCASSWVKWRVW